MAEPWLRGTHRELGAVVRQVVHSLEMAWEDGELWCGGLTNVEMEARPFGLAPVGFHLRHVSRSLDRLLTYAEGRGLDAGQREALASEMTGGGLAVGSAAGFAVGLVGAGAAMAELREGLRSAEVRVRGLRAEEFEAARGVGRAGLPSTLGGLLVHCAEHTQRHMGQAVTTAKVVVAMRDAGRQQAGVARG